MRVTKANPLPSPPSLWQLACTLAAGIPSAGAAWLALEGLDALNLEEADWNHPKAREPITTGLRVRGYLQNRGLRLQWPEPIHVEEIAAQVAQTGIALLWRDQPGFPPHLRTQLGAHAPHWLWRAGAAERLTVPAISIVGSRESPANLQGAAHALAQELAAAGLPVVSGMATGADSAAHAGALAAGAAGAGTIAFPARGLLRLNFTPIESGAMTALCAGRPDAMFTAALAIARNDLIAAQGHVLVLVASGLGGGSSYAVDWARRHGTPIFCFECGNATPPTNKHLLKAGHATALTITGKRADIPTWLNQIQTTLAAKSKTKPSHALPDGQTDLLNQA